MSACATPCATPASSAASSPGSNVPPRKTSSATSKAPYRSPMAPNPKSTPSHRTKKVPNAPRSLRNGLTKASPNVTKSLCFTPPVATHQLGSEKSTASPSWTPQLCHPLPIQNPTFKIHHRAPLSPAFPSTVPKALSAEPSSSPAYPPGKSARKMTTKLAHSSSEPPVLSNCSRSHQKI